jgi:hypothetical protein
VRCKKIVVVKTNPDGTFEMVNKSPVAAFKPPPECESTPVETSTVASTERESAERKQCNFKHFNESRDSYLKRVPYTSHHIRASRDKESVNRQNDSSGNRQTAGRQTAGRQTAGRHATKGRNQNRRK